MEPVRDTADFVARVQDYFDKEYTDTQLDFVVQWCEQRRPKHLNYIFRYLVATSETQYKSLPTVAKLREVWRR